MLGVGTGEFFVVTARGVGGAVVVAGEGCPVVVFEVFDEVAGNEEAGKQLQLLVFGGAHAAHEVVDG